jgi:hypothetical protein
MPASDLYVSGGGIDADDVCAALCQGLAQKTGTTTHIENFQSG